MARSLAARIGRADLDASGPDVGPIAELNIGSWARVETAHDVNPQAYYSMATLWLMRSSGSWVLLSLSIITT